jgi:putative endonuclease
VTGPPVSAGASRAARGAAAEALAADFLRARGCIIVERNYRCRLGEIDLIARFGDTLLFVEVRLRARADYGGAAASISAAKRRRMQRAARHYLGSQAHAPNCRFDAILLDALDAGAIQWLTGIDV